MKRVIILIVAMIVALPVADEVTIIKNPKPTCVEKEYRQLVKVKELREEEDAEEFLVKPCSLVVDERGHIFAWDAAQAKIFQYDPDLNLVRTFGRRGQGPGEIGGSGPLYAKLYLRGDELLLPDYSNRKILCFSTKADRVRDIPIRDRFSPMYCAAVDAAGRIYLSRDNQDDNQYVIDCHDGSGMYIRGYLDYAHMLQGLFRKVFYKSRILSGKMANRMRCHWYTINTPSNPLFSVSHDNRLVVYSATSGNLWVYCDGKLLNSARLWPRNALSDYKAKLNSIADENSFFYFFRDLFLDRENPDSAFLQFGYFEQGDRMFLYRFNMSGKLENVYYVQSPKRAYISIHYKHGNKYYGITMNKHMNYTLSIFQEAI